MAGLFMGLGTAYNQTVETNAEGYKILRFDDGSWRYYQPADSIYLTPEPRKEQASESEPEPEPEYLDINSLVENLVLTAKFERDRYSNAQAKKLYLENQLQVAKQSPGPKQKQRVDQYKADLDQAKRLESEYKKSFKKAQKLADSGLDVLHQSPEKQTRFVQKYYDIEEAKMQKIQAEKEEAQKLAAAKNTPPQPSSYDRSSVKVDFIVNPPASDCRVDQSYDELTGVKRVDTDKRLLLKYSPEKLRPYLKGEPYIHVYSYLTAVRGYVLMNLEFVIATDKASASVGGIERNAEIIFQFLDGTRAVVNNRLATEGRIDPLKKNTSFLLQCEVNKNLKKIFSRQLLDKIIVNWKRGYQEYPVYDLDYFHELFKCLDEGA